MIRETIIIPAYDPDLKLLSLIHNLKNNGFSRIIVINDGSSDLLNFIFLSAEENGCTIVNHTTNRGKGEAIKSGIRKHIEMYGESTGVITVDADGQHLAIDVLRISAAMSEHPDELILGVRDFDSGNVPWKSRYGNKITSVFFKLSTGVKCPDTQTGLRGIPSNLLDLAANEEGTRYEYEMRFLEDAVRQAPMEYVPIETVYEDNNSCSHFRPIRDSIRIYSKPLKFTASSLAGAAVDIGVFYLLLMIFNNIIPAAIIVAAATVIARLCSGLTNFTINKIWCFKSKNKTGSDLWKYGLLFIIQMFTSAALVSILTNIIPALAAKIIVDLLLFFISYRIQKLIIFRPATRRDVEMKPKWTVVYGTLLASYTAFVLLDAFVIPHDTVKLDTVTTTSASSNTVNSTGNISTTEQISTESSDESSNRHHKHGLGRKKSGSNISEVNATGLNTEEDDDTSVVSDTSSTASSDLSYESDNVAITITKEYVNDTYIYVADVQLKNSSSILSGVAENTMGRNITEKTSVISEEVGAILSINGDYYGFRDTGYVMRNGYLYRTESSGADSEDLVVYEDGTMEIIREGDITAEELQKKGAVQIYSFGPGLVENGSVSVDESDEVDRSMTSNPRTAIGYYSSDHYCFVVSDGRTSESEGLSLYELAQFMESLGVTSAYNLDGGGSSTMYFNGQIINNPTTNGNKISERSVSDIIYVAG